MDTKQTVRLLRECDAGIKMGVSAIDDVIDYVKNEEFKDLLNDSKNEHDKLKGDIQSLLDKYHDDGKDPSAVAKGMSWMKTNVKMAVNESDNTIADLMTDGCNSGVKSLHRYLNQYTNADTSAKDITKRLVNIEERLAVDIRRFL